MRLQVTQGLREGLPWWATENALPFIPFFDGVRDEERADHLHYYDSQLQWHHVDTDTQIAWTTSESVRNTRVFYQVGSQKINFSDACLIGLKTKADIFTSKHCLIS